MAEHNLARTLTRKDTLALAFGAMVGWGWVIMAGTWIERGGTLGAITAFLVVGSMILVIALLYAELAAAMPQVGGEHVYSLRALGRKASFVCTWAIVMVYVSVCAFEAVALATVFEYLAPNYKQVLLWRVAGYDVYLTWMLMGIGGALAVTVINYLGIKFSAVFQTVVTVVIFVAGIMLMTGALFEGSPGNMEPLWVAGTSGIILVVAMVPYMFTGFDVIPQAAEEINLEPNAIGKLVVFSVIMALAWYCAIIFAVSYLMDAKQLAAASLSTADAAGVAWGNAGAKLLILGGIAGIATSWNAFVIGGSRAIYALAESGMLPNYLAAIHPKYKTPYRAIILIGLLAAIAPFFGRPVLVWIVDAGSFAAVIAYLFVALTFIQLRRKEPDMPRPFKLKGGTSLGWLGLVCTLLLAAAYMPGSPSALIWPQEWLMLVLWFGLGYGLFIASDRQYQQRQSNKPSNS